MLCCFPDVCFGTSSGPHQNHSYYWSCKTALWKDGLKCHPSTFWPCKISAAHRYYYKGTQSNKYHTTNARNISADQGNQRKGNRCDLFALVKYLTRKPVTYHNNHSFVDWIKIYSLTWLSLAFYFINKQGLIMSIKDDTCTIMSNKHDNLTASINEYLSDDQLNIMDEVEYTVVTVS